MLRHIAHHVPESVSRISFSKWRPRTHTHVMSWNQMIGPGNDNPWITHYVKLIAYISCMNISCCCSGVRDRALSLSLLLYRCCWFCASSVGQNGVNRPRVFKVIFARGGYNRTAGLRTPTARSVFFLYECAFYICTFARWHPRFLCCKLHELWRRNARRR